MLIPRRNPPVNIPPIFIGNSTIEWVSKSRLLGMTVDEKLTWTQHMLEFKKSFAKKLGLLTVRLIFHLPKDMASADVLQRAQWPTLSIYYKLAILSVFIKLSTIGYLSH